MGVGVILLFFSVLGDVFNKSIISLFIKNKFEVIIRTSSGTYKIKITCVQGKVLLLPVVKKCKDTFSLPKEDNVTSSSVYILSVVFTSLRTRNDRVSFP